MKKFSFVKNQKIFFIIVAVVVVIGIISFFTNGFNVDIDFIGGSEITYNLNKTVTKDDEAAIEDAVIAAIGKDNFSSIRVSEENVIIRTKVVDSNDNTSEISKKIGEIMAEFRPDAIFDESSIETDKIYTLPASEITEEVTEETTEETIEETTVADETAEADEVTADEAVTEEENAEAEENAVEEDTVEEDTEVAEETEESETEEEAPAAPEWTDEDIAAIKQKLADVNADGLNVYASGANLHITFESSSPVAKLRSDITDAITALYDTTSDMSKSIDKKVSEKYAGAVLSEDSSETYKTYTLVTEETDEEGNPVLYTWTDEDVTAVETILSDLGIADYSVDAVESDLYVAFTGTSPVEWLSTDTVSAEISAGLKSSAITATIIAVILMLIYIAFRFQLSSAFAAVVCLAHDLFVMIVAYSLFQIPVNSTIIAALLTILGYSINATIIIFDRIRENDKKFTDNESFTNKVDDGIRSTFRRSLNTTLTTLFTIGMIYILGVTSIKNFALPLIVGIVAGLFSSVCLAGPLWRLFKKLGKKIRNK